MASAEVMPNSGNSSRKQGHLEAGKRRLEEFRKKKAAERAKKVNTSNQPQPAEAGLNENQPLETGRVQIIGSDVADTSDGVAGAVMEPSGAVINNDIKGTEATLEIDSVFSNQAHVNNFYGNNNYAPLEPHAKGQEFREYDLSSGQVNYIPQEKWNSDKGGIKFGSTGRLADGIVTEQTSTFHSPSFRDVNNSSSQYGNSGIPGTISKNNDSQLGDFTFINPGTSHDLVTNISPDRLSSTLLQNRPGNAALLADVPIFSSYGDAYNIGENSKGISGYNNTITPDIGGRNPSSFVGHMTSASTPSIPSSEFRSTGYDFEARGSSNHVDENKTRRFRPSFLDSIVSSSSSAPILHSEPEKTDSFSSTAHPIDFLTSAASQTNTNSVGSAGNGPGLFRYGVNEHNMERNHDFRSLKQDEDFAALEQHIEDLTQEKFSLQRTLEASRALADSLAAENSALTDSYNQQGSAVQQLKSDMERLQDEIKAHQVELESVQIEYANAQLECNAADERAKLLASEVIGLEEKALRLRSSELKLERQLENLQAEMFSYKKKISSLEKERQDLQFTIEALQEEKKVLQSKLRKASASGKVVDVSKSLNNRKNMSTSTEDLVDKDDVDNIYTSNLEMRTAAISGSDAASSSSAQPENREFRLEGVDMNIPPDQMRMIQNINTLMSELALEKEELVQALSAESSQSSKLKELNKELSRKLEVQTQRLELLTAQSMASDNIAARQPNLPPVQENNAYADEGDEVVERVLGWIMQLFPGGPSKRRTSKLL